MCIYRNTYVCSTYLYTYIRIFMCICHCTYIYLYVQIPMKQSMRYICLTLPYTLCAKRHNHHKPLNLCA